LQNDLLESSFIVLIVLVVNITESNIKTN